MWSNKYTRSSLLLVWLIMRSKDNSVMHHSLHVFHTVMVFSNECLSVNFCWYELLKSPVYFWWLLVQFPTLVWGTVYLTQCYSAQKRWWNCVFAWTRQQAPPAFEFIPEKWSISISVNGLTASDLLYCLWHHIEVIKLYLV